MDENINMPADEAAKEALSRGSIIVTLQRGSAIRTEFNLDDEPAIVPMRSLKTSEKVIKDYCKTHAVK